MATQSTVPQAGRSLELYCQIDGRITTHWRDAASGALVCASCGRHLDPASSGQEVSARVLARPPRRVRVPRQMARPKPTRSWVMTLLPALAVAVATLSIVSIGKNVLGGQVETPRTVPPVVAALPEIPSVTPVREVQIGNTEGQGAFIRRTPNLDDRIVPWPDGTLLRVTGASRTADGLEWWPVEDPAGNVGWIPATYTTAP